jgi:uncharacterized protein
MFNIWVDADSCPLQVRQIILRFAQRLTIQVKYVANRPIPTDKSNLCTMILCDDAPDAADNYIVEHIGSDDLAITRDIPLAKRLVDKQIITMNDRGLLFTDQNIAQKLALRNLHLELVESGIPIEKTGSYSKKDLNMFANCLDRELQKKIRKQQTDVK